MRAGELPEYLSGVSGGIKAVVAQARAARAAPRPRPPASPLADRPAIARLELSQTAAPGHLVVLVARVSADGALDVMGQVDDAKVTARAVKALG